MREERPKLSVWRILKEDQQAQVFAFVTAVAGTSFICQRFFFMQPSISSSPMVIISAVGAISLLLLVRRIFTANHLLRNGLLVKGRVSSSRYTVYGHYEVNYRFNVHGEEVSGTKEVAGDILPNNGDIWLIVSPMDFEKHFIIDQRTWSEYT